MAPQRTRLTRGYYVGLDTNGYSVGPHVIGRHVDVSGDLERVRVHVKGCMVAEHARVWARGMTLSDGAQVARAAFLRQQFQRPRVSQSDSTKQIPYQATALKSPRVAEAAERVADQARDANWSLDDYLCAVLEREISARQASGSELRIRAAGLLTRESLKDFDFEVQHSVRGAIAALTSGAHLHEVRNVVFLGPLGTGKSHLATGLAIAAARQGHRVLFALASK